MTAAPAASYSETLRMEAALCIWEAMLETINFPDQQKKGTWKGTLGETFERRGTVEMRHTAIALADKALAVFDLIGRHEGAEALDLLPYDWEFIPAFVARVDWTDCTADPVDIAARIKERRP